jgi:hypothetical protein
MRRFLCVFLAAVGLAVAIPQQGAAVTHTQPVAHVSSANDVFRSYMRRFCGNGSGVWNYCISMGSAYCTNVGGYRYYCTTSWTEHYLGGFRNQAADGHVYQSDVTDYNYWTTGTY